MDFITFLRQEFPRIVKRYFWIFILFVVVGGASAYYYVSSQPNVYEAQNKLLIGPNTSIALTDLDSLRIGGELIQTYAELADTRPVMEAVIEDLDLNIDPTTLRDQVDISINEDTRILTVTVTSTDKDEAVEIANAYGDAIYQLSPTGNEATRILRAQLEDHAYELESIMAETENYIQRLETQLASVPDFFDAEEGLSSINSFDRQEYLRVRLGDLRIELSYALRAQAEIYNVLKEEIFNDTEYTDAARENLIANAEDFDQIIAEMENEVASLEEELLVLESQTDEFSGQYDALEEQRLLLDQLATERNLLADSLLTQTNITEILDTTIPNEVTIVEPSAESILVDKQLPFVVGSAALAGLIVAGLLVAAIEVFDWKMPSVSGTASKKEEKSSIA